MDFGDFDGWDAGADGWYDDGSTSYDNDDWTWGNDAWQEAPWPAASADGSAAPSPATDNAASVPIPTEEYYKGGKSKGKQGQKSQGQNAGKGPGCANCGAPTHTIENCPWKEWAQSNKDKTRLRNETTTYTQEIILHRRMPP